MSIIEQAKIEMEYNKFDKEDTEIMINILEKFFSQWDSGGAVAIMQPVLTRLISGLPLSPLTGEDSEWVQVETSPPLWQNRRCYSVFKTNETTYDICADETNKIDFPYMPKTNMVEFPLYEI